VAQNEPYYVYFDLHMMVDQDIFEMVMQFCVAGEQILSHFQK